MEYLRSKELQKLADKTTAILDERNSEQQGRIISALCDDIPASMSARIALGESVVPDVQLDGWVQKLAATKGGKMVAHHILNTPISDTSTLDERARIARTLDVNTVKEVQRLTQDEPAVLWLLALPTSLADAWPLHMLFPSWPVLRYVNLIPPLLTMLHVYKGYLSPVLNAAYPVSGITGPYFYLKKYLKLKMTFVQYLGILKLSVCYMLRPLPTLTQNATKYFTVFVYVALFIYGLFQGFDMAYLVRKMHSEVSKKMTRIHAFVVRARGLLESVGTSDLQAFAPCIGSDQENKPLCIENNMTSFYKLVTDRGQRNALADLVKRVYVLDAMCGAHRMSRMRGWSRCTYVDDGETRLWGMGHPLLGGGQVRNPLSLSRNIVITGPNAGGKTTYMKSVCANVLLAQTFGFVCAQVNRIRPVDAVSTSIRIHDSVGNESLFEAEVRRCAAIVKEAQDIDARGGRAIYFLDEPMHSTPPVEGAATAMSVATFIGTLPGVRMFVTTHYHEVTRLEEMYPDAWMNVSMEAIAAEHGFTFPYRLRKGPSFQCIALEILKDRAMPEEIIETAIEFKNKICRVVVDSH